MQQDMAWTASELWGSQAAAMSSLGHVRALVWPDWGMGLSCYGPSCVWPLSSVWLPCYLIASPFAFSPGCCVVIQRAAAWHP